MNAVFRGFWASTMATSSMTLALFEGFRHLSPFEKSPLPPAKLTDEIGRATGFTDGLSPEMQSEATMISHYGYGAAAGITYALIADKLPGNSIVKGSLFGLGVWAASYYGLIPAMNLSPQGQQMPKGRDTMMLMSHIVWGASLGFAEQSLREKGFQMLDGKHQGLRALLH